MDDALGGMANEVGYQVGRELTMPTIKEPEANLATQEIAKVLARMERALESLSGQAIAVTNKDKLQRQGLERIKARLRAIEERLALSRQSPPPPLVGMMWLCRGRSGPPQRPPQQRRPRPPPTLRHLLRRQPHRHPPPPTL